MSLLGSIGIATFRDHTFLAGALSSESVVVDLGANEGDFSRLIFRQFGCRCIAVEPTPSLAQKLGLFAGLEVYHAAITNTNEPVCFYIAAESVASSLSRVVGASAVDQTIVSGMTFARLLQLSNTSKVHLLKVDIEGAEIELFDSVALQILAEIDQISIEFHDFCGVTEPAQVKRVRQRIISAGFDEVRFGLGNINTLYVNRRARHIGRVRRIAAKHIIAPLRRLWHLARIPFGIHPVGTQLSHA